MLKKLNSIAFTKAIFIVLTLIVSTVLVGCDQFDFGSIGNNSVLKLDQANVELAVGDSFTVNVTQIPDEVVDQLVTWTSSNEEVVTVENGVLTAVGVGQSTVTASVGSFSATVSVTVETGFIVTFNVNGGSPVASLNVIEGETATEPTDPSKAGNIFAGWYTDETYEVEFDFNTPITEDTTVFAKWDVFENGYTLIFFVDGGSPVPQQNILDEEVTVKPDDPSKDGFVFAGWYTDDTYTEEFVFDKVLTENTTVFAKWEAEVSEDGYTLTFESNGGSSVPQQVIAAGEVTVEPTDPTNNGLGFGGWYADEAFTVPFEFGEVLTVNTTVYAKWNDGYQVVFESPNGVFTVTVAPGETVTQPEDPIREGYRFLGWVYSNGGELLPFDFTTPITSNIVIMTDWEQTAFTVTFIVNYGDPIPEQVVSVGDTISNPLENFENEIFDFGGFYLDEDHEETVNLQDLTVNKDLTIYVKLIPTEFSEVTFVLNDGIWSISGTEYLMDEEPSQSFDLSYFNPDESEYGAGKLYSLFLINKDTVLELEGLGLFIGIDRNENGLYAVSSIYTNAMDVDLSIHDYVLLGYEDYSSGYRFLESLTVGQIITVSKFNDATEDGPVSGKINVYSESVLYSENIIDLFYSQVIPVTPVREGYTFLGWYAEADFSGQVRDKFYYNTTFYAKWVEGDYYGDANVETFDNLTYNEDGYYDYMIISSTYHHWYGWSLDNVNGVPEQYQIDGNGALLIIPIGHEELSSSITSNQNIPGGMKKFSVDLKVAFDNDEERKVELILNGVSYGVFTLDNNNTGVQTFTVDNINIEGDVRIKLRHAGTGSEPAGIVVDNITWYPYGD